MFFRYLKSENGSDDLKFHANPRVIPYGLGKRKCLGERLAKMSLYKFFSALIQKYEIVSGQTEPITDERDLGFIKAPLKYKLIFKPRTECKWKLCIRLKTQEFYAVTVFTPDCLFSSVNENYIEDWYVLLIFDEK